MFFSDQNLKIIPIYSERTQNDITYKNRSVSPDHFDFCLLFLVFVLFKVFENYLVDYNSKTGFPMKNPHKISSHPVQNQEKSAHPILRINNTVLIIYKFFR